MTFDKQNLKDFRTDLNAALKAVQEKYGLSELITGNIKFTDHEANIQIRAALPKTNASLSQLLANLGLPADLIGRHMIIKNRKYVVTGVSERPSMQRIECSDVLTNGKYKISTVACLRNLVSSDDVVKIDWRE